ncbi:unnamed protein product (macronuclear) [Paramecium tetraurelia]|uniref:Uncharacterized protein n=1 Tax=Paramecium tetraurelia TaxID=5888 RepID=A0E5E4_PARTE|nr:uncharacterized protein GSPATT00023688001 [Paramecium tetraurelia]CAK90511.1 unnamed protein product [Paramecium tetraurelia]|eukprot:XP_001457908.1 hypothetical protein (macronuclear) [Paramecium tetraurelia strain d4-2]
MNKSKFILIRHAESEYNLAARLAVNSSKEVTNFKEESLKIKQDESLIDCGLTQYGIQQCLESATKMSSFKVDIVLVSPLRRAIQTAHYLFRDHPNKPKFIVVPFLREMLSSSCDIGGNLTTTMNEYSQFDFSRTLNTEFLQQYPNMWTMEYLWNQEQKQQMKQYLLQQQCDDLNSRGPKHILDYLFQYPPDSVVETFMDTMNRIQQAKLELSFYRNQNVVCVTHSRFLQTISASQFDAEGKPKDGTWIKNCDYIEVDI